MSTINRVPYNSTIIDRIFSQMPAGFSSDPIEQDAVVFSAESNNLFKNATITNVASYIASNFSTVQNGGSTYVDVALPIIIDGTLVSGANSSSSSSYRMTVSMSSIISSTNTSPVVGQSFSAYIANSGKIVSGTIESIQSFTCAATISGTTMTVTGTPGGVLTVGQIVVLAGTVAEGTMITALVGGTGGAGTYTVSISQTVATSTTVTIIGQTLYVIIPNLSCFANNQIPSSSLSISEVYCSFSLDVSKISFSISDSTLTISSDETEILSENIDLENYTIESLIYYFNNKYSGKSSQLVMKLADKAPSTILEMSASILSEGSSSLENGIIVWPRFTSQNYSLLMMFALIIKTYKKLIIGAINQTDHRLASKDWLEHWGSILGVPRESYEEFSLESSEPDIIYRERMRREVMLPKVSNESIKYLTSQATGRAISVSDGGQPFLLYSSSNQATNTLPVVVNKGYTSGEITVSGTTVSGLGSAFFTDFPSPLSSLSPDNYGKLIVDTKGYSEARQVASVSFNNTLTLASPFSNTYTNTPIYYDSIASIADNTITSCLIYVTSSGTTLTVGATQFGSIVSGKTYMYDTGGTTFSGAATTFKSTPVSGYCSGSTFTVTNTYPASISGTISGNVLRVTAISSGQIVVGQLFTGTNVTANSIVTAFGTGTGGLGTYYLSQSSTVTTTTSMTADATLIAGQKLSGVGIPDGVFITSGSGGIGTYTISPSNYSGYCAFTASIASYTMNVTAISSGSLQVGQTILTGLSDTSTTIVSISKGTSPNIYVCILSKSASVNATSMTAAKSVDNLVCFAKQYTLSATVTQSTPTWKLARASTPIFVASSTYSYSYVPQASISGKTITVHSATGTAFFVNQVINGAGILSGTTLGSSLAISATSTATVSKWHTGSFTATISGNIMSVSAVATGGLEVGQNIFGANVASNSVVLAQLSGTAGGVGTYQLSLPSTISSSSLTSAVATAVFMATISGTTMTVTSVLSGSLRVNHTINGYSTNITAMSTGTSGGIGTYTLSVSATISSSTLMIATVLPGTGDFVYSGNAVLTPGLTLAGAGVDSSTKIVGPNIVAATASGSITGQTFSSSNFNGTFAVGYGLMGDDIVPGTFFTATNTVNRVYNISSKPMVAISGTWAQCATGSIAGTVLTTGGTPTNTFYPGMSIFVNAFFTATISSSTMTVSAVSEGTLAIGMVVTGLNVPTNTVITALGTGTGGIGTYTISTSATISTEIIMMAEFILPPNTKIVSQSSSAVFNLSASVSASFTASFSTTTMTVTAVSAGTLDIGQIVTGTSVTANSVIIAFGTGAGSVGTYTLSQTNSLTGVSCTATKTIASKQIQGWKSGREWIVSASSSVGPIPITASTVGYQHKKAASGTPALTDAAALSYFLGPSTGGGSFSVTVPLADGETSVPQKVLSFVRLLVSKYKPAGIPYTIN